MEEGSLGNFDKEEYERKMQMISFMEYIGYFKIKLTREDINKFRTEFNVKKTYLVYGDQERLKKVGAYFLGAMGRPTYKMVNFSKAVNLVFDGEYEDAESVRDNSLELFILYIRQNTPNIANEQYLTPILDSRYEKGLPTLVLSESNYRLPSISTLPYLDIVDSLGNLKEVPVKNKIVVTGGSQNIDSTLTGKAGCPRYTRNSGMGKQ
jgi:hypothetical protein